ncbi:sporulation protein Cse60 [Paenibacillus sp. tmac-D7]|uniref:sporulation protein Cse60 n=1 Tax=Paenibacillus sp. tmac-D7 TaxID=2591462 RepID=UPI0011430C8B|nr:sporulation protein Cse60 [Paenibacillus sp. tmac-D7]
MIQVKEFVDTDNSYAEHKANEFLAGLNETQVVNVCYGSVIKTTPSGKETQRSTILIVYRTKAKRET